MSKKFLVAIDLAKNELQNAIIHNLAGAPSGPGKGQVYFSTTDNVLYWWDGTTWIPAKDAGAGAPSVPITRSIITTAPLTGGGDLSADRTLAITPFGGSTPGSVPSSVGGTANFLRADGTWAAPPGGLTQAAADALYVNVSGDTMTGPLSMGTQPINFAAGDISSVGSDLQINSGAQVRLATGGVTRLLASNSNLSATVPLLLPADPTSALHAATKQYVDNLVTGLAWSDTARAATTANITLSGAQSIDGVAVAVNDRVLVKNQTTPSANGVYIVQSGAWTRATDADSEAELLNMAVFVSEGTTQGDTAWVSTANAPITVGSTNLPWSQFAGAGTITAGGGLTQTGNVLDVGAGSGIIVAADTVALDTTFTDARYAGAGTVIKRFTANVGGSTAQAIAHNLATRDVQVEVYRNGTPWDTIECDVERTDTNTVTLRFTIAPAANEYRVVVIA